MTESDPAMPLVPPIWSGLILNLVATTVFNIAEQAVAEANTAIRRGKRLMQAAAQLRDAAARIDPELQGLIGYASPAVPQPSQSEDTSCLCGDPSCCEREPGFAPQAASPSLGDFADPGDLADLGPAGHAREASPGARPQNDRAAPRSCPHPQPVGGAPHTQGDNAHAGVGSGSAVLDSVARAATSRDWRTLIDELPLTERVRLRAALGDSPAERPTEGPSDSGVPSPT